MAPFNLHRVQGTCFHLDEYSPFLQLRGDRVASLEAEDLVRSPPRGADPSTLSCMDSRSHDGSGENGKLNLKVLQERGTYSRHEGS